MALPNTVTTLHCPNGSVVHIVGTAHFSKESVEDVRSTIARTKPQVRMRNVEAILYDLFN